jgi:hypothetical protein
MEAPCHAVIIQKKDVLEFWKEKKWKRAQNGKMYMKNNGTYSVRPKTWPLFK